MKMKLFLPVLAVASLAYVPPALAGVQPGKWELTVDVSLSQGSGRTGPIVETRCISEDEARNPQRILAESGHEACIFTDARDSGAEYTFAVECRGGPVPVHGNGRVGYTAQTLDGTIDLIAEQPNLRIVTHSSVKGRRLGSCNS
jgi:hypothetical protein